MILVALATLGAVAVAFVLHPVFAEEHAGKLLPRGEEERERTDLEEKKNRLYEAITDLDFEKDAGKVSPTDYETARNDYLAQVAAVLGRLDELSPKKSKGKKKSAEPAAPPESRKCAKCSESSPESAKFCVACGAPLDATCGACGETLPAGARFCPGCGKKTTG